MVNAVPKGARIIVDSIASAIVAPLIIMFMTTGMNARELPMAKSIVALLFVLSIYHPIMPAMAARGAMNNSMSVKPEMDRSMSGGIGNSP